MNWYFEVLKKYAVFQGRAHRTEYWMFFLFNLIIAVVLGIFAGAANVAWLNFLYSIAVILPGLAVGARRLHDTNRSGWWLLLGLIPILGFIVLIFFFIQDSHPGANQYGPNPKGVGGETGPSTEQRLRELDLMRQRGVITDTEYDDKRRRIISEM